MKYQLNQDEQTIFTYKAAHYAYPKGRGGGYQYLARALIKRYNKTTGEIDLDEAIIERIWKYTRPKYGSGGFQDTFLVPVFRRILKMDEPI